MCRPEVSRPLRCVLRARIHACAALRRLPDDTLPPRRRVQPGQSVAELIAPGVHFTGQPTRNGLVDGVSIQDWQSSLDSRLCARRQYRGQGI